MRTLIAVTYASLEAASAGLAKMQELQKGAALSMIDAVIVSRKPDGAVKLDQSVNMTAVGAASGAFWGSLLGLIFLAPLLGAAVGASAGAISGYATDYGISDDFMKSMGEKLSGSSSTLFILAANMTPDKVADALKGGEITYTSMPEDAERTFKGRAAGTNPPQAAPRGQGSAELPPSVLSGVGPQPSA